MSVKIEQVTESKSKRSHRVLLSGKWYGAKKEMGLDKMIGQEIEASITTSEFGPWIDAYKVVGSAQVTTAPAPAPKQSFAEPQSRVADNLSEAELRFISNVVGQAILAKTITDSTDVRLWALAAKEALKALI